MRNNGHIEYKPKSGPGSRNTNKYCVSIKGNKYPSNAILTMVIVTPMLFAMVSADPTNAGGAFCAFRVENCGESPETVSPQISRNTKSIGVGAKKNSGDNRQHKPEIASCVLATQLLPISCDR